MNLKCFKDKKILLIIDVVHRRLLRLHECRVERFCLYYAKGVAKTICISE
jgi:hypothetical protein